MSREIRCTNRRSSGSSGSANHWAGLAVNGAGVLILKQPLI
jgi:hypothetical protein